MTDRDYEAKRNALIDQAEAITNQKHGETHGENNKLIWDKQWTLTFLATMNQLAIDKGLISRAF